jgi:hypothetical protein
VFKEVHRDVSVHFDFATTDTLRTVLSLGCRALHFSGHGIPRGLCFEDGRGGLQVVRVAQLRDLLGAGGLSLQFVFVSACYSMEIGEAFVRAGVPHVVCVKVDTKIQDAAAIAFTRAFYVAFLSGKTVKASFAIAKEALKASPYVPNSLLEGPKFVLLPDESLPAESGDELLGEMLLDTALLLLLVSRCPCSPPPSILTFISFPPSASLQCTTTTTRHCSATAPTASGLWRAGTAPWARIWWTSRHSSPARGFLARQQTSRAERW